VLLVAWGVEASPVEVRIRNHSGQKVQVEAQGGASYVVDNSQRIELWQESGGGLIAINPEQGAGVGLDVAGASVLAGSRFTAFIGTNTAAGGLTLVAAQEKTASQGWGLGFGVGLMVAGFGWSIRYLRGIFTQGPDI